MYEQAQGVVMKMNRIKSNHLYIVGGETLLLLLGSSTYLEPLIYRRNENEAKQVVLASMFRVRPMLQYLICILY